MEGYQWGGGGEWGKGTGNKKHNWQVQNRGRPRILKEMEKPENLYVGPMDMNQGVGNAGGSGDAGQRRIKGGKMGQL